ncbi:hypothetical protein BDV27DRAFT_121298 [Aspergillus caelatus]|uniref:Uncharacterized protein n=1 Tax=Aspergillus caelatus TaxID=61420 RepID=A0A5N7AIQ1_9EURO|nr:uncharacterized protein BDV27DRAFT_121298 [Aspergillus caelatus]KAE8369058.1 hypothetical protein BDV27DRAFT_121298 [Aspergillus caelatus]
MPGPTCTCSTDLGTRSLCVLCNAEKRCMLHYPYAYPVVGSSCIEVLSTCLE